MIFYLVFLYELPSQHATDFNHAFRDRRDRMGKIPGWIHTDLLEQSSPTRFLSRFLSISFFTSLEAVQLAERTPEMQTLLRWASGKTTLSVNLGTFSFPPWPESDEDQHRLSAQTGRP